MADELFRSLNELPVRAVLVGERIDVRAFEHTERMAANPLTVRTGQGGMAVLFRDGAAVLFNLEPAEEAVFLDVLRRFVTAPYDDPEREQVRCLRLGEGHERVDGDGAVHLADFSVERLQVVADILAKSVLLGLYERRIAGVFDRVDPVAKALKGGRRMGLPTRDLLAQIGEVLMTHHRMIGRFEVTEKPDLLWDHPQLERLYHRLRDEFELAERSRAMERKLTLVTQTVATSLDLLQNQRSLRVEWYIVILIVIEIGLSLYELFFKRG